MRNIYSLLLLSLLITACDETQVELNDTGFQLTREPKATLDRHIWSAGVANRQDKDNVAIWIAGHGGALNDLVITPNALPDWSPEPLLPPGRDRHSCTTADFNLDNKTDYYCSTGAERGSITNNAELWLSGPSSELTDSAIAWGVSEPSARGRRVQAADLNRDGVADLVTTAWSDPTQTHVGRTKLWINTGTEFKPVYQPTDTAFGAKCLSVLDLNNDDYPELVGCNRDRGITLLVNQKGQDFKELKTNPWPNDPSENFWWSLAASTQYKHQLVAGIVGTRGRQFIALLSFDQTSLNPKVMSRLPCQLNQEEKEAEVFCAEVLFTDVNADQLEDLWIVRRKGWRHERMTGDASEIIALGPDFTRFVSVPPSEAGGTSEILPLNHGFVEITAGESWPGEIAYIAPLAHGDTSSER